MKTGIKWGIERMQGTQQPRFVSLRWRFTLPISIVIIVIVTIGGYLLAGNLTGNMEIPQINVLLESSRAISERTVRLYENQRDEAERIAYTQGVAEAISSGQSIDLLDPLEALARLAELDSLIVTDAYGVEAIGLQRVEIREMVDYSISNDTDLSNEPLVRSVLDEGYFGATGLLRTPQGILLYTATPITLNNEVVGIALVGQSLERALSELQSSAMADVALYGPDGALIQTTFPVNDSTLSALRLAPEVFNQALVAVQQIPVQSLQVGDVSYQGAYFPFNYGPAMLGVTAVLLPDNIPFMTELPRQMMSVVLAGLSASVVIVVFIGVTRVTGRVNRVTQVAQALAVGERTARTGMQATDEIGAVGQALDQYADYAQERQDTLRLKLRRQRRETAHLMSVLESLPDGIVVQDLDGRVVLMNDKARKLLGSQRVFRSANLHELTAVVTDVLGASLAPGLYALGDPRRVDLDGKMLSAQAAAVISMSGERVGMVSVLRDITDEVRRDRARESLLDHLEQDVQEPLADLARLPASSSSYPLTAFAQDITRHAVALQKLVVEMRQLTTMDGERGIRRGQRALRLDTLTWAVANEWRQVAQAANLSLQVILERSDLYVLGDEHRLRWAIGNIVDNAIKFTPPGGKLTLEIRGATEGQALMRVRDNGVGISPDELPQIFTRFFRGNPVTQGGRVIRVPGTGQGLSIAKQIFDAHGGTIRIRSKQGVGTEVSFTLPLTAPMGMELPLLAVDMDEETVHLNRNH
jgi:PAS domain S-box-containing protein